MTIGDGMAVSACIWGAVQLVRAYSRVRALRSVDHAFGKIKDLAEAYSAKGSP